jgi:hopanoid biosynthesis associated RND transporter like protein HpnN
MTHSPSAWAGAWVGASIRHAGGVILAVLALTLLLGGYAATHLGVNMDNESTLLAEYLPVQKRARAFQKRFPVLNDALLVVVDAPTAEAARAASRTLSEALEARPDVASDVFDVASEPFFERHALLYRSVDELERFSDQMVQLQPVLAELAASPDLTTFTSLLARLVGPDGAQRSEEVAPLLDSFGDATVAVYSERPLSVSWAELIQRDSEFQESPRSTLVVAPVLDFEALLPAGRPISEIRSLAAERGLTPEAGYRVRITGYPALNDEEMRGLVFDVGIAGLFSFAVVLVVLGFAFRSWQMVVAAATSLVVGLVWCAAFGAAAVGRLNVVSIAFAVLVIGLGVDFAIHLGMQYTARLREGLAHEAAMVESARRVGPVLVLCALTTSIGFFSFVPTDYKGVAELGLIAGAGMFIILALTLTLFPALLTRGLSLRGVVVRAPMALDPAGIFSHPVAVLLVAAGLAAVAVPFALDVRFDSNVVRMRNPDTESVKTWEELLASGTGTPWYADVVVANEAEARALAPRLEALPEVASTTTILDYVPTEQDDKLDILADLELVFDLPSGTRSAVAEPVSEQLAALRQLHAALDPDVLVRAGPSLAPSARALRQRLGDYLERIEREEDPTEVLAVLEESLLGRFPAQLDRLLNTFTAGPVTQADLPSRLQKRMVAADGGLRMQVFPSGDLYQERELTGFVDAVAGIAPEVTGLPAILVEFGRATARSLAEALALALGSILLILLVLWRRLGDSLLAIAPLALAGLWTVGALGALGLPFNFVNVVALPLLLGIGIDSGIHLVQRARDPRPMEAGLAATTTGRAVFFSAVTTLTSFGSLAMASHLGVASMGLLLIVGMSFTLVANLVVLPAWLAWRSGAAGGKSDVEVSGALRP